MSSQSETAKNLTASHWTAMISHSQTTANNIPHESIMKALCAA